MAAHTADLDPRLFSIFIIWYEIADFHKTVEKMTIPRIFLTFSTKNIINLHKQAGDTVLHAWDAQNRSGAVSELKTLVGGASC